MTLLVTVVLVCAASVPTLADGVQQKGEDTVRLQIARLIEQCDELVDVAMFESVDSAARRLDSLNAAITNRFGESDTLLAMTYRVLSRCHHWRGDYDLAGAYAHKAIAVWEKEIGPNHR